MKLSTLRACAVLALTSAALAACGQRGPLTLPKPPAPMAKPDGAANTPPSASPGKAQNTSTTQP